MRPHPPWTKDDIPELLRRRKIIRYPFTKPVQKPTHPSMQRMHIQLEHPDGSIMEGMEAAIEWRSTHAPEGCNERYMLFAEIENDFVPIFRIEVYPSWKRSHAKEQGKHIYGPHIHYQHHVRRTSASFDCGDEHRWRWLDRFLRHIHGDLVYDSGVGGLFDPRSVPLF